MTDRAAYEAELAVAGKEPIDELYEKHLDRSKTVSIWSECIETMSFACRRLDGRGVDVAGSSPGDGAEIA